MLIGELLKYGENELKNSSIDSFRLDAKIILEHVLNVDTTFNKGEHANEEEISQFKTLINRRVLREPTAKIINKKYFWKSEFFVDGSVLDPRPDTETIMESVLKDFKSENELRILDLGVGSGCIIISLLKEFKNARGVAVDIGEKSLKTAKFNADRLGVLNRINFLQGNWNDDLVGEFDIIVSNPPYIETAKVETLGDDVKKYEPREALDGGIDGLFCYRYLAKNIKKNCTKGTRLYFEVGFGKAPEVKEIFEKQGFNFIKFTKDLSGTDRVCIFFCTTYFNYDNFNFILHHQNHSRKNIFGV
jgi:release factor glutamine methyltransferase